MFNLVFLVAIKVDEKTGRITGGFKPYALCGFLRRSVSYCSIVLIKSLSRFPPPPSQGESDDALNNLTHKDKISAGYVSTVNFFFLVTELYKSFFLLLM